MKYKIYAKKRNEVYKQMLALSKRTDVINNKRMQLKKKLNKLSNTYYDKKRRK